MRLIRSGPPHPQQLEPTTQAFPHFSLDRKKRRIPPASISNNLLNNVHREGSTTMPLKFNIYANPVIAPGFYWAKVVDLRAEQVDEGRPRLHIRLQIGPMHEGAAGLTLASIIHPTDAARFFYINFMNAYRIAGTNYEQAIGRWASVGVYTADYQGTRYSAVRYTHQPLLIRTNAIILERAEALGRLDQETLGQVMIEQFGCD
jgi:hypothetical protein